MAGEGAVPRDDSGDDSGGATNRQNKSRFKTKVMCS